MTGTIAGRYTAQDGTPHNAAVYIIPSVASIKDAAGDTIISGTLRIPLVDGAFSAEVPASDDETLDPSGVTYTVKCTAPAVREVAGVFVPDGTTVQMAEVTPSDPEAPSYAAQVSVAEFNALAGQVAVGDTRFPSGPTRPTFDGWLIYYQTDPVTGELIDAHDTPATIPEGI